VDIQNLKEILRPEAWEALRRYVLGEVRVELESRLRTAFSSPASPLPAEEVKPELFPALPPKRNPTHKSRGKRNVEFPPPLDPATLAYFPAKVRKMPRVHEGVALRRDLIVEGLKPAVAGASEEDLVAHLAQANFPVDSAYYAATLGGGRLRIRAAILNDLTYFLKRGWVRRLTGGKWKWIRSKFYEKE
jgi:hypothetical protein